MWFARKSGKCGICLNAYYHSSNICIVLVSFRILGSLPNAIQTTQGQSALHACFSKSVFFAFVVDTKTCTGHRETWIGSFAVRSFCWTWWTHLEAPGQSDWRGIHTSNDCSFEPTRWAKAGGPYCQLLICFGYNSRQFQVCHFSHLDDGVETRATELAKGFCPSSKEE